jgi:hypothetical protein
LIFPFLVYPLGFLDVLLLRFLCPSAQEDNDDPMALCEIGSVAGAVVDPHFANAVADRLDVTGVPKTEAIDRIAILATAWRSFSLLNQAENSAVLTTVFIEK